ncbi:MAG: HU family DNA-binding protein [SAR324 cluster bacterium]|nr:HU family DNA-binding protein [SAR324 cluster bacterium]
MIKYDIALALSHKFDLPTKQAAYLSEAILKSVKDALKTDGTVMITGFGKFEVKQKAARIGRNPKTKQKHTIKERKSISFYPSPMFKKDINKKIIT